MKFPNAYSGIKKLYYLELMSLLCAVVVLVASVMAALGSLATLAGTLVLISSIAALVIFILQLVALNKAGKDEQQLKFAFYATILSVVFSFLASLFSMLSQSDSMALIVSLLNVATTGATLAAACYILLGIAALAKKLGNKEMEEKGIKLNKFVIGLFVTSIVLNLLGSFLNANGSKAIATIISIISIVAAIVEIVIYVCKLLYYKKAVQMLEE